MKPDPAYAPAFRAPHRGPQTMLPPPPPLDRPLGEAIEYRKSSRAGGMAAEVFWPVLSALLHYTLRTAEEPVDRGWPYETTWRRAPSAGGMYPLECYVALPGGLSWYDPRGHRLVDAPSGETTLADTARELAAGSMYAWQPPRCVLLLAERAGRRYPQARESGNAALVSQDVGVLYGHWGLLCAALDVGGCCLGPAAWDVPGWPWEPLRGAFAVW